VATLLAKFSTAPNGTQWRPKPPGRWYTASVGDPLYEDYECQNTEQSDYQLEVYSEVEVEFPDGITDVEAYGKITGSADYLNSQQQWVTFPGSGTVQAHAVRTDEDSVLPIIIAGKRGISKPRGW